MNGDTATGVSIIHMSERMDAGDVAMQKEVPIGPNETFGTLEKRLASLGHMPSLRSLSHDAGQGLSNPPR